MESLASSLEAIRCCHCWRQDNRLDGFWGMNQAGNSYLPDLNKANRFPATKASWLPIFQLSRNPNFSNNCFVLEHCELEHSYPEFCFIPRPPLVEYGFWHEKADFKEAKRSLKKSCFSNILLLYIIFTTQCHSACRDPAENKFIL